MERMIYQFLARLASVYCCVQASIFLFWLYFYPVLNQYPLLNSDTFINLSGCVFFLVVGVALSMMEFKPKPKEEKSKPQSSSNIVDDGSIVY